MFRGTVPLEEDGACELELFRKLVIQTAKMDGRDIGSTGRWNDIHNADGSAKGNFQSEIVCRMWSPFFHGLSKEESICAKISHVNDEYHARKKTTPEVLVVDFFSINFSCCYTHMIFVVVLCF